MGCSFFLIYRLWEELTIYIKVLHIEGATIQLSKASIQSSNNIRPSYRREPEREELLLELREELLLLFEEELLRLLETELLDELLLELLRRELDDTELLFDEELLRSLDTELLDFVLLLRRVVLPDTPVPREALSRLLVETEEPLAALVRRFPPFDTLVRLLLVEVDVVVLLRDDVAREGVSEVTAVRRFSSELTSTRRLFSSREGTFTYPALRLLRLFS